MTFTTELCQLIAQQHDYIINPTQELLALGMVREWCVKEWCGQGEGGMVRERDEGEGGVVREWNGMVMVWYGDGGGWVIVDIG